VNRPTGGHGARGVSSSGAKGRALTALRKVERSRGHRQPARAKLFTRALRLDYFLLNELAPLLWGIPFNRPGYDNPAMVRYCVAASYPARMSFALAIASLALAISSWSSGCRFSILIPVGAVSGKVAGRGGALSGSNGSHRAAPKPLALPIHYGEPVQLEFDFMVD
jgi:hypothetical protein